MNPETLKAMKAAQRRRRESGLAVITRSDFKDCVEDFDALIAEYDQLVAEVERQAREIEELRGERDALLRSMNVAID